MSDLAHMEFLPRFGPSDVANASGSMPFRLLPPRPTDPPPNEQPVAEGDGLRVQVSIYPLMRSSTPQSHHFALMTALGMLGKNKEP